MVYTWKPRNVNGFPVGGDRSKWGLEGAGVSAGGNQLNADLVLRGQHVHDAARHVRVGRIQGPEVVEYFFVPLEVPIRGNVGVDGINRGDLACPSD